MRHVARGLLLLCCFATLAAADQRVFEGRTLEDALRLLQREGLLIVFSSDVVKPEIRVLVEPRSSVPRQQLDELLAPHGLKADAGPRRLLLVVIDRSAPPREATLAPSANRARTPPRPPSPSQPNATQYADHVTVWGRGEQPLESAGSDSNLTGTAVDLASSVMSGD